MNSTKLVAMPKAPKQTGINSDSKSRYLIRAIVASTVFVLSVGFAASHQSLWLQAVILIAAVSGIWLFVLRAAEFYLVLGTTGWFLYFWGLELGGRTASPAFNPGYVPGQNSHLTALALATVFLVPLVGMVLTRELKLRRLLTKNNLLLVAFLLGFVALQALRADIYSPGVQRRLGFYLLEAVVFTVVAAQINPTRLKLTPACFVWFGTIAGVASLRWFALPPAVAQALQDRLTAAPGWDSISNGITLGLALLVVFWKILTTRAWTPQRIATSAITTVLLTIFMVYSQARGPMVGLVAGSAVLLFAYELKRLKYLLVVLVISSVLVTTLANGNYLAGVTPARYAQSLSLLTESSGANGDLSIRERLKLYRGAWSLLTNDPRNWIVGIGYPNLSGPGGPGFYTHNVALDVLVELGIFGLALYVGIIIISLKRAYALLRSTSGFVRDYSALWASFLVFALVISNTSGSLEGSPVLWLAVLWIGKLQAFRQIERVQPAAAGSANLHLNVSASNDPPDFHSHVQT